MRIGVMNTGRNRMSSVQMKRLLRSARNDNTNDGTMFLSCEELRSARGDAAIQFLKTDTIYRIYSNLGSNNTD